jgi:hypothetical protein
VCVRWRGQRERIERTKEKGPNLINKLPENNNKNKIEITR